MRLLLAGAIVALALFAACGDDGYDASPTPTNTPFVSSDASAGAVLCDLLPDAVVERVTGHAVIDREPFSAAGGQSFCQLTLEVFGCERCAITLNDLGAPNDTAETSTEGFRASFESANAGTAPTYQEDVLGPESWLGVTHGASPGYKQLYFQGDGRAYTLNTPRQQDGVLSEAEVIALGQEVLTNLGAAPQ